MLYFEMIYFHIISRSQQLSLYHVATLKGLPVHRYSVIILKVSDLKGSTLLSGNRVALNLGGVRDVAPAIISQTQSNRVCYFQILDAIFPKDHLEITTALWRL